MKKHLNLHTLNRKVLKIKYYGKLIAFAICVLFVFVFAAQMIYLSVTDIDINIAQKAIAVAITAIGCIILGYALPEAFVDVRDNARKAYKQATKSYKNHN